MTGTLRTLDRTGDTAVAWDKADELSVTRVRAKFDELADLGYMAYAAEDGRGDAGVQVREFDPDAQAIIMVRPMQGG